MKLSDLATLLARVQQFAGDVDIVLRDAETEAESVITDLGIHFDPTSGQTGGQLTVTHGQAPAAPPAEPEPAAAETAPADGATADQ